MTMKDRRRYIGASEAAAVLGRSRWGTPLSVWAQKTGNIVEPPEETNVKAKDWGKRHEPTIIQWFEEETGKKVSHCQEQIFHPDYDFLGATVDGLIEDESAGFEAKTADRWKAREWEGERIPEEYIIQAYHSMMVTGRRKWYIAVLIGGNDPHQKLVVWDQKIIDEIREREVSFWKDFVEPEIMPMQVSWKDTSTLDAMFPVADETMVVDLDDDANKLIENLAALKQDYKNLEHQIETTENELKAKLGDAEAGRTSLYLVKWKNIVSSRFDTKTFKSAHPQLADQFLKQITSRRFTYGPRTKE